jgi:hypothetical protein
MHVFAISAPGGGSRRLHLPSPPARADEGRVGGLRTHSPRVDAPGAAAPTEHGASLVVLRMAEITLIDAVTSQQGIGEVERNLTDKLPTVLPAFHMIVS